MLYILILLCVVWFVNFNISNYKEGFSFVILSKLFTKSLIILILALSSVYFINDIENKHTEPKVIEINKQYENLNLNRRENDIKINQNKLFNLGNDDTYIITLRNKNDRFKTKEYYIYKPEFIKDNKPYKPDLNKDVIEKVEIKDIVLVDNSGQKGAYQAKIYFY